jgi:hypothetical protein
MCKALFLVLATILSLGGTANANDSVSNGTVLQGALSSDLSSATAQVGDQVVINGVRDDSGAITGTLFGKVTRVQKAGQGTHAQLNFFIDRLSTQGTNYSVTAVSEGITSPGAKAGKVTTAAVVGALSGALLGRLLGHTTGAMIAGAVAGAGTGFLLRSNNYQDIVLPQGSTVKVLLRSVTRLQMRAAGNR